MYIEYGCHQSLAPRDNKINLKDNKILLDIYKVVLFVFLCRKLTEPHAMVDVIIGTLVIL